ncbi:MAG: NAD(P)H nitroreductase [Bacteroidales bacterium]|nr:NAD(P)H nitroreductase [Bacteroidales bacterium]
MDLHELLLRRHSIRRYTDKPIDPEDVKTILEAGLLAPSSKNARSWQFVVVEDRDTLIRLSECKPAYATSIKDAMLAVVVTSAPAESEAYIEDASVAAIFMHLQAEALGIGSCWVQVRGRLSADGEPSEDVVRDILAIPHEMTVECIMTFGYSAETRKPVDPAKLKWEKVHLGSWRNQE